MWRSGRDALRHIFNLLLKSFYHFAYDEISIL
jgi:hypothetical protein